MIATDRMGMPQTNPQLNQPAAVDQGPLREGGPHIDAPIFIVGTARSGTTLLASILDSHSGVSCGPETAFFYRLNAGVRSRILEDAAWPNEAVRYLLSLKLLSGNIVERYGLSQEDLQAALRNRSPSIQAVLEALTVTFAQRRGRRRWAEKSPSHLLHLKRIRALWPEAAIIRIVRDPRGVAASHLHIPWGPRTVVGAAYIWQFHDDAARGFLASDSRSMTIRYEDLLANPEHQLRRVCEFIGEPFEVAMLDPGRSPGTTEHAWKSSLVIDAGRADAWRAELSTLDQRRVATICADGMQRHAYAGGIAPRQTLLVQPYDMALDRAKDLLEEAADRRIALRSLPRRGRRPGRDPILFYGGPRTLRWVQRDRGEGGRTLARWARLIVTARLRGGTLLWIADRGVREPDNSWTERACDAFLRLAVRRTERTAALNRIAAPESMPGQA